MSKNRYDMEENVYVSVLDFINLHGVYFIFDFDGPIVDSTPQGFKVFQKAAANANCYPIPNAKQLAKFWGARLEELIALVGNSLGWPEHKFIDVLMQFNSLTQSVHYEHRPGVRQALLDISKRANKIGILTNRDAATLRVHMKEHGLNAVPFDLIETPKDFQKPDPRAFDHFWEKGFDPLRTIFVGDSVDYDFKAAKGSVPELDFVGITTVLQNNKDFLSQGVPKENIFSSLPEMVANLDNIRIRNRQLVN